MEPRDLSAYDRYEAGRGVEEVARERGRDPGEFLELASNENPLGPAPAAVEAIEEHTGAVHRYPKASHVDLREAVAGRWDLPPGQVWLGAGADGALDYLARATVDPDLDAGVDGGAVLVPDPGFAYYPMSARYAGARTVRSYPLSGPTFEQTADAVLDAYDGERLVYLTAPHSPTGRGFPPREVAAVAEGTHPETLVVVDEAYGEFTPTPSAATMLGGAPRHRPDPDPDAVAAAPDPVSADREDVAVLRTFSKAYGLAGLRVGYALVPGAWADACAAVNTPFAVNELACRAALAAVESGEHLGRSVRLARWARRYLRRHLAAPTVDSEANFVLVDVGEGNADAVTDRAEREGLLVRDCTSFGLPGHVRVTVGTREGTRHAVRTLNRVLDELGLADPGAVADDAATDGGGNGGDGA